jgi:hypothetical protein
LNPEEDCGEEEQNGAGEEKDPTIWGVSTEMEGKE